MHACMRVYECVYVHACMCDSTVTELRFTQFFCINKCMQIFAFSESWYAARMEILYWNGQLVWTPALGD